MVIPPNANTTQRLLLAKYRHMMIRELNKQEMELTQLVQLFRGSIRLGVVMFTGLLNVGIKQIEKERNGYR